MKKLHSVFVYFGLIPLVISCSNNNTKEKADTVKSDVVVAHPYLQDYDVYENFQGVTKYFQTINIRTKMPGMIKRVFIKPADILVSGQPLFIIQPKELSVLSKTVRDNQLFINGYDTIYSSCEGIVSTVNFQQGDYIQEGDLLAVTITRSSLAVIAYFPFSSENKIGQNKTCFIVFPDSSQIAGQIANRIYSTEPNIQAQPYIVNFTSDSFVPENLNVIVKHKTKTINKGMFISIKALFSDEEQKNFWVMKMINDSTCIKVPVLKGIKSDSSVEINANALTPADLIVTEGGYGLSDTALVEVIQN
jgi:hypothetical protein